MYWIRRALQAGLYRESLRVAASGWMLILTAVVDRLLVAIRGRRPVEIIEITHDHNYSIPQKLG